MPRKQQRYRNYAAAAKAAAIPLLCSRDTALMQQPQKQPRYRSYAAAAMPLLAAYPERKLRRIVCWLLILSAEIRRIYFVHFETRCYYP